MPRNVDRLSVPPMDLSISDAGNGKLKVELNVPRTSGSLENIPFLEVTRNEHAALLNGARQNMIARLSQSGFQIGEITYEGTNGQNLGGNVGANGSLPRIGKVSFEISAGANSSSTISGSLRNNPDVAGAIRDTESQFDTRRQDIYEQRAREWHRQGGATLTSGGETYTVGPEAARTYINERHPLNPFKRVSADSDAVVAGAQTFSNDPQLERQFAQALSGIQTTGTPNQRDAAALAVQAISSTPGYDPAGEVRVVAGAKGDLIVFQGQGETGVRAAVPEAKPGDFERVTDQLAQQPVALAAQQPETERNKTQAI